MKCPIDQETLLITERQGIEIDYCPTCRGVWLDRGELDKLISAGGSSRETPVPNRSKQFGYQEPRFKQDNHSYKKKKKESFLKDLFDF